VFYLLTTYYVKIAHSKCSYGVPVLLGVVAFGLGIAATISCDFMRISSNNTSIGLWCLEHTTLSTEDKVARAFSALALIFGGLLVLMGMLRNGIVLHFGV